MFCNPSHALRLSIVISLVGYVVGDIQAKQFQWQFKDSSLAPSIPSCATFPIVVKPFDLSQPNTNRTPPYYMIAFAVGGTPITSLIGSDENNLSWTVTHPVGSQLLLSVVDANGNPGGIPPQLVKVIPGQTTQCVANPPSTPTFEVSANVTGDLQTCQQWGIRIKGGAPPYVLTLAELNQPVVTNVTIPNGFDAFTYPNRAEPGSQLIAAVSDFTGRWANKTVIVNTVGSSDTNCTGLVSASGDAATLEAADAAAVAAIEGAQQRKKTATAVAVTLTLLLVFGLAGLVFLRLRKRKREAEIERAETEARQFTEPESKMLSITNYLVSTSDPSTDVKGSLTSVSSNPLFTNSTNTVVVAEPAPPYISSKINLPRAKVDALGVANPSSTPIRRPSSRTSNPGFANFPATSIRRSAKAMEAAVVQNPSPDSEYSQDGLPSSSSTRISQAETVGGSRVLQHRDAGSVRELPPPYADRTSRPRSS